jgi:hypothetical protein
MSLKQQTVVEARVEVDIEPALKKKLQQRLDVLRKLRAELDAAKAKFDKEKANIEGYFEQTGATSINVDGYAKITEVRGTTDVFDKKKFVELGGSLKMIENATFPKPKKPYVLITLEDRP